MKISIRRIVELFVLISFTALLMLLLFLYDGLMRSERKIEEEKVHYFLTTLLEGQLPFLMTELDSKRFKTILVRSQIIQASYRKENLSFFLISKDGQDLLNNIPSDEKKIVLNGFNSFKSNDKIYLKRAVRIGSDDLGFIILGATPESQTSGL